MDRLTIIILMMLVSNIAVADYFNTQRLQKIIGLFVTEKSQIQEVNSFSNAFAFAPASPRDITQYLDENKGRMLPVISISRLLLDEQTGMYHHDVTSIVEAIAKAKHKDTEILFLMDEPFWWVRRACEEKGKAEACLDVANRYVETLSTFRIAGQLLRKHLPGSGIIHIEAWAELVLQKKAYPEENVVMLDDAEYLGFDCYGGIEFCGSDEYGYYSQFEYGTWVWDAMLAMESQQAIGRKLFVIPGTFLADGHFADIDTLINQIGFYGWILNQSDKIGGFGAFLWGDMVENNKPFTGGRNILQATNFLKVIARYYGVKTNEK
ncbi:MAG TPA: hypothetical protein PK473_02715 [Nitrosomonas sp.]|nr:hypothetical protein [Nitrosomonas sp.]